MRRTRRVTGPRVVRRRAAGTRLPGPCTVINPGRPRVETVQKTVFQAWDSFSAANTAAPGGSVTDHRSQYFYYNFDPYGASSKHVRYMLDNTGALSGSTGKLTSSGHAFPDYQGYKGLYQFFRVKWLKVTHTLTTVETTDGALFPTMYLRALYDTNILTTMGNGSTVPPSAVDKILEFTRVKRMQFNAATNARSITYKVYPREWDSTLLRFIKPQWHDFDSTSSNPRTYGLLVAFQDVLGADQFIDVNLEWCMQFKTHQ